MATLREEEFENFLKRKLGALNGLLIHGADQAAVSLMARRVVTALKAEVAQIDLSTAKSAPGSFMDQMLSLSMFGDRQVLLIDGADEACLKFLEPALAQTSIANFVLITADNLGKISKLRAAVEGAELFTSLALYEEEESAARERIRKLLAAQNLNWGSSAEEAFFASVGSERAIVTAEAEKLALYALGQGEVNIEDVAAICGDVAEFDVDELVDAILGGDIETADRIYAALGGEQQRFFFAFAAHLSRLQNLRIDMEGSGLEGALRNAKPPIFFKRKNVIAAQLRALSLEDVVGIQETVQSGILQSRKMSALAEPILGRMILAIARSCRSKMAA